MVVVFFGPRYTDMSCLCGGCRLATDLLDSQTPVFIGTVKVHRSQVQWTRNVCTFIVPRATHITSYIINVDKKSAFLPTFPCQRSFLGQISNNLQQFLVHDEMNMHQIYE